MLQTNEEEEGGGAAHILLPDFKPSAIPDCGSISETVLVTTENCYTFKVCSDSSFILSTFVYFQNNKPSKFLGFNLPVQHYRGSLGFGNFED